jgi:hypothetical protein
LWEVIEGLKKEQWVPQAEETKEDPAAILGRLEAGAYTRPLFTST